MLKKALVALVGTATLVGALASPALAHAKPGDYFGNVYGPVPGAVPGVTQQDVSSGIGLWVGKTSLDIKVFAGYGCDYPKASQGGFITTPEMVFLNVPISPLGHFALSGPFGHGKVQTAGSPGGTGTISGQITGERASGSFSRSAHLEGVSKCRAVSVTWKATYNANGGPFFE